MRYLIVSDLHGNSEALAAVEESARGAWDDALCCGDLVGYGADPNAAVEWARRTCSLIVRGNHDRLCSGAGHLDWFNPSARQAAEWTLAELTPENRAFTAALPRGPAVVEAFRLAHGSPLDEDTYVSLAAEARPIFTNCGLPLVFFGHTHQQGGFAFDGERIVEIPPPPPGREANVIWIDPARRYLINPGSVGQPRDGDPRAAFALYDSSSGRLELRRVPYSIGQAQEKIRAAGLPERLAARLAAGR